MKKIFTLLFLFTMLLFQKVQGRQAAAGNSHNLIIKTDGTLWAWGLNTYGQLGDGTTIDKNTPSQIGTATDWKFVAAGEVHSIAMKSDGSLWAWGSNSNGQLGDGTIIDKIIPTQIGTTKDWGYITAGNGNTLAIKTDGSLWAWGFNSNGQLGDGTNTVKNIPTQIGTAKDWKTVDAAGSILAIKTDGSLWAWKLIKSGQLGNTTTEDKIIPSQIGTSFDWKNIAAGSGHNIALKTDGTLWAWGLNWSGMLGDGSTIDKTTPTQIGKASDWKTIAAGNSFSTAIKIDGSLWAWGFNSLGQLGDGTGRNSNIPTRIGTEIDWEFISLGGYQTLAIKTDGDIYTWGYNKYGQIGGGITGDKKIPSKIGKALDWKNIAGGSGHTIALKTDGGLWAWGTNNSGQLGDSTLIINNSPTRIGIASDWKTIAAGGSFSLSIKTDGSLWAWGWNAEGQLGDGTFINKKIPTQIGTADNWKSIVTSGSHTVAIKTDGSLWAWGNNSAGQLGDGTQTVRNTPTQIGNATDWETISAKSTHTLAIKTDGSLWAWGYNAYGELGDGTTINKTIPTQIGTAKDWKTIIAGFNHNLAIKTDGSLWGWGLNSFGELGDGTEDGSKTTIKNIPTKIGTATDWKTIYAGFNYSLAIKTDGSLWAWGDNSFGVLGDGTTVGKNIPTRIDTATDWETIYADFSHSLAIKTDGSSWAWGDNSSGQLGDGTGFYTTPQNINFNVGKQIKIGDSMDGGIVGHIFQPGDFGYIAGEINGIIVAPQDLSGLYIWGPYNPTEYAKNFTTISTQIGKGNSNSNTILNVATLTNTDYPAARAAMNYENENFNDWFLPSSGELMILKQNLFDNNIGNFVNATYWSSSVMQNYVGALAPMFNTINGICGCAVFERYRVRPIRYFSFSTTSTLAPTGNTTQTFCSGSTVDQLTVAGTAIKWYTTSTGGTTLANSTVLINGTTYYATQTVNSVESAGRLAVTVSIPKLSFIASLTNVALGSNASLAGSISGSATFQWQSDINDIGWINLPNNSTYTGSNTNRLTINNIKVSNHLQEFRLIATAGNCRDTSNVATTSVIYSLPVELISFEATLKKQNQVNLNWKTSSELNNSHFTINKSRDGKSFTPLTTVASKGDGGIYLAVDQNPFSGTTYYQLSQTDKDGKTEELGIKAVNFSLANTQKVVIYPNPTQNEVKVSFEKDFYTTAKLIDLQGKTLQKKIIFLNDTELTFDLKSLDAGSYLIQLEGKALNVQKVVKE
jgi:alpha-tubulin suppressor-like RCC1 family protein